MASTTFDALDYFEKLKAAGVPEEQAKIQANALKKAFNDRLVTKEYLDARLRKLELRLEYDLTIRLGGIVVACTAFMLAGLPLILK